MASGLVADECRGAGWLSGGDIGVRVLAPLLCTSLTRLSCCSLSYSPKDHVTPFIWGVL